MFTLLVDLDMTIMIVIWSSLQHKSRLNPFEPFGAKTQILQWLLMQE